MCTIRKSFVIQGNVGKEVVEEAETETTDEQVGGQKDRVIYRFGVGHKKGTVTQQADRKVGK